MIAANRKSPLEEAMLRTIHTWFLAARPYSFSTSFTPLILGTVLACANGYAMKWDLFIMILFAGVFLHAGVNYLNSYGDFVTGVDTLESAESCPHLVQGILAPSPMFVLGVALLGISGVLGLVLVMRCGWPILVFGGLGLIAGYGYTTGPKPYKYMGLGPFVVFFLMGPFMVCPAYFVQSGEIPFSIFWISLAIACLVTGVIQANDIHDMTHDKASGIRTMALAIGRRRAIIIFCGCYVAAFLILGISVFLRMLPFAALLPLVLLPDLFRRIHGLAVKGKREGEISVLLFWAAGFHAKFGILLVLGLLLSMVLS